MKTCFKTLFAVAIAATTLLSSSPLAAQNDSLLLKEFTVYGSFLDLKTSQSGRNTTVITGDQIQHLPVQSIDELFWFIPSMELQSRGGFGTQSDITMRGSTFNQVVVLIDGMRVNDPLTGHFNGNLPITPAEIKQIEIIRGPSSALYGPDAVGGVINILTHSFYPDSEPDSHAELSITAGENDYRATNSGFRWQNGKFAVGGGVLVNQSNGQLLPEDTLRSEFDLQTYSASVGYRPNDKWNFAVRGAWDYRDFNAVYYYTRSTFDRSVETVRRGWAQGTARFRPNDRQQTELQLAYQWNQDTFLFNPLFAGNNHDSRFSIARLTHRRQLNAQLGLTVGAEVDRREIESSDRGNHETNHWGVFATALYRPLDGLSIVPGVRLDNDAAYGTEVSPQVNVSYRLPKITLRGASGRGIRAADFTERYVSNNLPGPLTAGRNYGNPDLEAERSWSHELGWDYRPFQWLEVRQTGFLRASTGLIDFTTTSGADIPNNGNLDPASDYFFSRNVSELTTTGFETEVWVTYRKDNLLVRSGVGYTYLSSETPDDGISKYIANHAGHAVSGSVQARWKRFGLSIAMRGKDRDSDDASAINRTLRKSYQVWNAKAQVEIWKGLSVHGTVLNVFDLEYSDILGATMPRRWVMGGVAWRSR